jgi:hypothetical protein
MPSVPFLVRQAPSLLNNTEFRDVLTDDDPLPTPLVVNEAGLVVSSETGHTAQQKETTDDR